MEKGNAEENQSSGTICRIDMGRKDVVEAEAAAMSQTVVYIEEENLRRRRETRKQESAGERIRKSVGKYRTGGGLHDEQWAARGVMRGQKEEPVKAPGSGKRVDAVCRLLLVVGTAYASASRRHDCCHWPQASRASPEVRRRVEDRSRSTSRSHLQIRVHEDE